mmetsp:Transcript_26326/g.70256  ORF Transcript_26326/g.70256 Transcript_26326/m.70256 type:complete len:296 (+) Transcript_26326:644-1531(+)
MAGPSMLITLRQVPALTSSAHSRVAIAANLRLPTPTSTIIPDGGLECPRERDAGAVGGTGYDALASCCEARLVSESREQALTPPPITEPTFLNSFKLRVAVGACRSRGEDGLASALEPGPEPCPPSALCSTMCPASSSAANGGSEELPPQPAGSGVSMDTRTGTTTLRHNRHHDMLIVPAWNSKGCKRELFVLCPAASSRRGGGWAIEGDYGPRSSASPASLAFSTTADMSPPLLPQDSPAFPLPPDFSASLSGAQSGNYFLLTDQETAALMHEAQGAGFDPFDESELEFMHYVE